MITPRLAFFTGGSALRDLSRELAKENIYSAHMVTTFDSGGSTAVLRKAFAIPAVGDLRNRLLALAADDEDIKKIRAFCAMRLPSDISPEKARSMLADLTRPGEGVWTTMPLPAAGILWRLLQYFFRRMPNQFDCRGACMGNLLIAAAYLEHNRDFGAPMALFSHLLHIRGIVAPIVDGNLHLSARLANGEIIVGQHLFKALPAPVTCLFLTVHESEAPLHTHSEPIHCRPQISDIARSAIKAAHAICYPMGSFYSSVLANLLPQGVGNAIFHSRARKIFIPNSGEDPELHGLSLPDQARLILEKLHGDNPDARDGDLLQFMLVDKLHGRYPGGIDAAVEAKIASMGIKLIDRRIVMESNSRKHAPDATLMALLELSAHG